MVKSKSPPADEPEQELFHGFLQIYRIKINNIDYLLFGPPITLEEEILTLELQEFRVGEVLPAETVLRSIRLAMDPEVRERMAKMMQ
jgi:hypothetical protein